MRSAPHDELNSRAPAPLVATIQIPPGAVTVAPPPALFGSACAAYLGMSESQARRALDDMSRDPTFASGVVVLSRRPRELAAPPADVLRFLRARRACLTANEPEIVEAAEGDAVDRDLAGLGFGGRPRARGAR
jgi:hypothetical protein